MNIRALRKDKGLSQRDIAESLGLSTSTVTKWETGKSKPRADMLIKLADLLGCSVDDILIGQKEKGGGRGGRY